MNATYLTSMSGTESQVEWAESIKIRVNDEFDRVARALRLVATHQHGDRRAETEAILVILEGKRSAVMNRTEAGYFIRTWQEISDQVRQMLFRDAEYKKIKAGRNISRVLPFPATQFISQP